MLTLSFSEALSTFEPIAWFLSSAPIFIYTIRQNPKSRWWLLPLNVLSSIQSYRTVNQLSTHLPGLDWLLAFTSLINVIHATSALYLEAWTIPARPLGAHPRWDTIMAFKAWMNPRRLHLRCNCEPGSSPATALQRLFFVAKRLALLAVLAALYLGIELGILFWLKPGPRDFAEPHQKYFHWRADREAAFRAVFAFHWAWLTYLILTVAHAALAVFFVGILQIDEPDEWPLLYGNPLAAYTVQRFWGTFWHSLGTRPQICHGRVITRKLLGLEAGSTAEKILLACWVFAVSGCIHALVTWKTEAEGDPLSDVWFLMLNFLAGLVELLIRRQGLLSGLGRRKTVLRRMAGYLCIVLLFYCIVPPYQFPVLHKAALRRLPFKVNMNINRRA
ncbi:hypothetical protein QQS21_003549 [Conoideocrella luteorostrata]|uniref:Wax synthase domain-containing protein n=1 Tax=Conoideocrella luteorostrata TaxID=1105319 RepID=A0AAJ0CT64_9HYPO|nr:hypothetical protein QQS21_003549 [Conoideocrella luteorostrata]